MENTREILKPCEYDEQTGKNLHKITQHTIFCFVTIKMQFSNENAGCSNVSYLDHKMIC